ncbi:unnamed protein product [Phytomonas sp. EM1]|nr:unnamed protein product [Phytomonas sp. EM1]|eukprot:CCW61792.1 unnamed protein product [Phytomonas sp. isolate EM1]
MNRTKGVGRIEFSSSDDDDLEQQLYQQMKYDKDKQRGIVRAHPIRGEYETFLHCGQTVRARKGTIFLPVRERYIHILDAKSCPERFFGDPGLRFHHRAPLSPDAVELFELSNLGGEGSRIVTLADAMPNEFYVFKSLRKDDTEISKEYEFIRQSEGSVLAEPRYQRITDYARWKRSCLHPIRLYAREGERFDTNKKLFEVISTDLYDRMWWYDGTDSLFGTLRYEAKICNFTKETCFSRLTSQKGIGVGYFQTACRSNDELEGALLVGEKYFAFVYLQDQQRDGTPLRQDLFYAASATQNECFQNCYIPEKSVPLPWLALSTDSTVMEARLSLQIGGWEMRKIRSYSARRPVTSLCAIDHSCDGPRIILCGLRNGTIQVIPLQYKCASYDNTSRHHDAEVSFLYPLYTEHQFISVASNVETKLWDLRYFSCKHSVATLHEGVRFGVHGDLSASIRNGLVAVSSPTLGIRCIDIKTRNILFETSDNVPTSSTILLHQVGMDYELVLFSSNSTQRYFLRNDT